VKYLKGLIHMKKKGDGLSINVIIVAAIALIVLVVLVAIFTGRMGNWGRGIDDATKGQKCSGTWSGTCGETEKPYVGLLSDAGEHQGQSCCIKK
jgi:hypothetical protein